MAPIPPFHWTDDEIREQFASLSTRRDVAALLDVPLAYLTAVLFRDGPEHYYRVWSISKKTGGSREIRAPSGGLYLLQKRLSVCLRVVYEPRRAAQGFVRGRSVVTNAIEHVGKRFVLNLDLEQFFPCLNFGRVRGVLMAQPFSCGPEAATFLAKIACVHNQLPIGGPASPVLANAICHRLDGQLTRLAKQQRSYYSRYADDLTFSTNRPSFPKELATYGYTTLDAQVGSELDEIIRSNGFRVNAKKTRLMTSEHRQEVTGVVVNEKPNVRRRYVRNVRAMVHSLEVLGPEGAQARFEELDRHDRGPRSGVTFSKALRGKIAYLSMVRGSNDALVRRLSAQTENLLAGRPRLDGVEARSDAPGQRTATLLHLSDFHFKPSDEWDQKAVVNDLLRALEDSREPDLVVVTGDISFSGRIDEYALAAKFFLEGLLPKLGLPPDRVYFVPGNHDVDRSLVGEMVRSSQEALIRDSDPDRHLAAILSSPEERSLLLKRFSAYSDFVADLTGDADRAKPWWSARREVNGIDLALVGLCSPLLSCGDTDRGNLILGQPTVNEATSEGPEIAISLLHHPFDYMIESDKPAIDRVKSWSDLILRGHLHTESAHREEWTEGEVVTLAAGSAYQGSRRRNGFNLISIDAGARTAHILPFRREAGSPTWSVSNDALGVGGATVQLPGRLRS